MCKAQPASKTAETKACFKCYLVETLFLKIRVEARIKADFKRCYGCINGHHFQVWVVEEYF